MAKSFYRLPAKDIRTAVAELLIGHFESKNLELVVHKEEYSEYCDDVKSMAIAPSTHNFVLNYQDKNLKKYERVKRLGITDNLTKIKYVCNVSPYYYFQLTDPDGNIIEVTGDYILEEGEFDE